MRTIIPLSLLVLSAALCLPVAGQTTEATAAEARTQPPAKSPKLTAEQRQAYATARDRVMEDAEYRAAVQRAIEAQRVADRLFFSKLLKAAPELRDYIVYLRSARRLAPADQP